MALNFIDNAMAYWKYIVDFISFKAHVIIERDGGQHADERTLK